MNDAKVMLEWYHGWDERDAYGHVEHKRGLIQKLANKAQELRESSNLGARFLNRTFGNFEVKRDPLAFNACKSYADRETLFDDKRNGMMILGGIGSGKTHLAAAIANAMIDRGIPALFGTYSDHLESIRGEYDHTGERKYLSMMKSAPILVLDDIGKEKRTEWTQQVLFDVINARYEHLLPTILTTNFDVDGLANYVGGAIWSRLYEMCSAVETQGSDFRRKEETA